MPIEDAHIQPGYIVQVIVNTEKQGIVSQPMAKINLKAYRNRVPNNSLLMTADRQQEMNQLFNITMLLGRKSNNNNNDEQQETANDGEDSDKFSRIEKKIENNLTYISISVDNTDTGSIVNYNGIMENCNFFDIEDELITLNA